MVDGWLVASSANRKAIHQVSSNNKITNKVGGGVRGVCRFWIIIILQYISGGLSMSCMVFALDTALLHLKVLNSWLARLHPR